MRSAWFVLVLSGCFHPSPPEGKACANGTDCPAPLVCDQGVCVRTPQDIVDAETPDVAIDADPSCACSGATLTCGTAPPVTCALGCMAQNPGARCLDVKPSNNVGIAAAAMLTTDISINTGVATFNTETGAISGSLTRSAGQGVSANIAFELRTVGTQGLGVWTFHRLGLNGGATIRFSGSRSAVFVSGTDVAIAGTIDGSGGCNNNPACAGPGGGTGAQTQAAKGCGPGGNGISASAGVSDGGGGGGGGRSVGGSGGLGGTDGTGGTPGGACVAANAEPLIGGSGGGVGGVGVTTACKGGGGGGALQITAFDVLTVDGTITMGGGGGEGGTPDATSTNAAAGCGGGAGGSILLEARVVKIGAGGVLAANGGAGGGGASLTVAGTAGENGGLTTAPAVGGGPANVSNGGSGGNGAAGNVGATAGGAVAGNAGGGGGGAGAIYVRATPGNFMSTGAVITPAAGNGPLRTQ